MSLLWPRSLVKRTPKAVLQADRIDLICATNKGDKYKTNPSRSFPILMNATSVKVTTSVLSVAATLAVAGRFWARKIKKQRYGLDDWTVLSSWVSAIDLPLICKQI